VTSLASVRLVNFHFLAICCIADFLDSELYPPDLENVALLNFVVLI
jgi:hypothetical protein